MHHANLRRLSFIALATSAAVIGACSSTSERGAFEMAELPNDPAIPPGGFGGSTGDDGPVKPAPSCIATQTKANHAAVDIIVVIDTSGSMSEETEQVKQNLNAFAQSIGAGGLDYNVIMIARKQRSNDSSLGICVQPPLAAPSCADAPLFHHLDVDVESYDSLEIVLREYPRYSQWLRIDAYKVFIEVTDDNSSLGWQSFDQQLLAKSAEQFGDPSERRYIFNSICGYKRGLSILSSEACGTAVNTGDQYQELSKLTGGTVDSVCETSFASVFDNIAKDLVTRVGCEFVFPRDDGKGHATDPASVIVKYTRQDGTAKPLTQVTDASKCETVPDAWHYDDERSPTKILFCPAMCTSAGADTEAKVDIDVGCKAPTPK